MRRPANQAKADNWQLYGRSTTITGSCTVHLKRDARLYKRVQPPLPEVSRCKLALFSSPKGSQYQLVSDMKLSQIGCSARDLLYIIRISHFTYSTNTDFSRDLQYVFINCACIPGFPIDCCTLLKCRCMIIVCILHPRVY